MLRQQRLSPLVIVVSSIIPTRISEAVSAVSGEHPFVVKGGDIFPTSDDFAMWLSPNITWPNGTRQMKDLEGMPRIKPPVRFRVFGDISEVLMPRWTHKGGLSAICDISGNAENPPLVHDVFDPIQQPRYIRSCELETLLGVPAESTNMLLKVKDESLGHREERRIAILRKTFPRTIAAFAVAAIATPVSSATS